MHKILLTFLFLFPIYGYAEIYAGAWVSNITPSKGDFKNTCLGGFGEPYSRCNSTEVLDEITVRVLSLRDDDVELLFVVIDTIGIGDTLSKKIKNKIVKLTNNRIKYNSIKTIATHTHSAPDLQGLWGGVSEKYKNKVINNAAFAAILSRSYSREVEIFASTTKANVNNRRAWNIIDDDVTILQFKSKGSGDNIASLINMSAHPTIIGRTNLGYSSGYINSLRQNIEIETQAPSIFINGILGDAKPITSALTYEESQLFGKNIAVSAIDAMKNYKHKVEGDLKWESTYLTHPVTNKNILIANSLGLLDIDINQDNTVTTQFSHFSIGDNVSGIGFPGEALTLLGLPLKNKLETKYKFFFGLFDFSYGYFMDSKEYLQVTGRNTEERASIDILAGDKAKTTIENLIEEER